MRLDCGAGLVDEDEEHFQLLRLLGNSRLIESFDELFDVGVAILIDPDLDLWQIAIGSRRASVGPFVGACYVMGVEGHDCIANA